MSGKDFAILIKIIFTLWASAAAIVFFFRLISADNKTVSFWDNYPKTKLDKILLTGFVIFVIVFMKSPGSLSPGFKSLSNILAVFSSYIFLVYLMLIFITLDNCWKMVRMITSLEKENEQLRSRLKKDSSS